MNAALKVNESMSGAFALVGFGVWQIYSAYSQTSPKIHEYRDADGFSTSDRQRLRDTDMLVGGLSLIAAGVACYVSGSFAPLLLTMLAFAFVSGYHHLVLARPTPGAIDGRESENE